MIASIDTSLIDWSRAQFALTAMYHWLFVPLTLGLGVIQAIMETIYYKTGNEFWKKTAQFWMKLFGINFAIGVATGLILEFEFGTNWSNYSWFVGDIFGAPLAIEGILAFFMEATFIAVMFFGWDKVSKRFHLASTWLTIIGATLSALWILIANAWMQYPVGMHFNPDTVRNEMFDFWAVALSPVAINKFFHTVLSGWIVGAVFVMGVSSWYLLKKRETEFSLESIKVGAVFGLVASILIVWTGDGSAYQVAQLGSRKDAEMALNRFALINLDEFDSIPASRQPYLKNLLQKAKVTLRKPYGESMEEMRRFASFIATSNTFSLLTDTTGSRRFIGVEVKGMIRIEPIDYPQLYAQAVSALREGERYWFTPEEEVLLNRNNRMFEKRPLLEELFLHYFRIPEEEEVCEPLSAPEILMTISKQSKIDLTETKLRLFGQLMQKYNVRKKMKKDRKYYYVIPETEEPGADVPVG